MQTTDNVGAVPIAAHGELLAPEKIRKNVHFSSATDLWCRVRLHRQRAELAA
jgi:hypothetical protein